MQALHNVTLIWNISTKFWPDCQKIVDLWCDRLTDICICNGNFLLALSLATVSIVFTIYRVSHIETAVMNWPQKPYITNKNFLILIVESSLAIKRPILAPFCGMDHQKSNFSLISDTLSVRGCWGQPMLLFWKLVGETQISKPFEATRHHI